MKIANLAIRIFAIVVILAIAYYFVAESTPLNNTNSNNNATLNSSTTNNITVNNSTLSNTSHDQNGNNIPPPPLEISADEAKDMAKKYVGPGVILAKPVKTTYKKIHVWQVPVYTMNHKFINNIYIDARTGRKVD